MLATNLLGKYNHHKNLFPDESFWLADENHLVTMLMHPITIENHLVTLERLSS